MASPRWPYLHEWDWLLDREADHCAGHERSQPSSHVQQWRAARIDRFRERQRRERKWINFADIAEWCSKDELSIPTNEQEKERVEEKRHATFLRLLADFLAGEFDEEGRSRVLFLHPTTAKSRMTREWLTVVDQRGGLLVHYLEHCWIPRSLFERWLAKHRLPSSPEHFRPWSATANKAKPTATVRQEKEATKALADHLKASPQLTRADAAQWCREAGYSLAKRAFERVWPNARVRAGLPRIAPAGRKSRSSRSNRPARDD